jgi:phospholipid-binding lipoprotein MlaA
VKRFLSVGLLALSLVACASGPLASSANPADPWEPMNRSVDRFNTAVDGAVLKPVASAYQEATPRLVQRGVSNFFGNLQDMWSVVNCVLQFKAQAATENLMRVSVNTVMGFGGLLDIATEMQIERTTKDFGTTLGVWGVGNGPYLVLPLLGPSTLRDTVALPVDFKGDPVAQTTDIAARNTLIVTRGVSQRAALLKAESVMDEVALDKYTFIRDAFLQRRRNTLYDGNPPDEDANSPPEEDAPAH